MAVVLSVTVASRSDFSGSFRVYFSGTTGAATGSAALIALRNAVR
jgi:hypothetical protein